MAAVAALPVLAQVAIGGSMAASALSAYTAYDSNKTASKQAQADADAAAGQGRVEAQRIREQIAKQQSAARAAAAENGLNVNEGTSLRINDEIERAGQQDAAYSEIVGFNSSQKLKAAASNYKRNASMSALAGAVNTTASGANTYGMVTGWK